MGLTRGVKFDLRRTRNKFLIFGTFVLFLLALLIARAFATLTVTIPVEITWNDSGNAYNSRPSSITLRLKDNGTEISYITLTNNDVDPNDPDKWLGSFVNVTYSPNLTIEEDAITNYSYTVDVGPSFSSAGIAFQLGADLLRRPAIQKFADRL